jgi:hypothetical protein
MMMASRTASFPLTWYGGRTGASPLARKAQDGRYDRIDRIAPFLREDGAGQIVSYRPLA